MGGTHKKFRDMDSLAGVADALERESAPVTDVQRKEPKKMKKSKSRSTLEGEPGAARSDAAALAKKSSKKEKKRKKVESRTEAASSDLDAEQADEDGKNRRSGFGKTAKRKKKEEKVTAGKETSQEDIEGSDSGGCDEFSEWIETAEKDDKATFKDLYRKMFNLEFALELPGEEDTLMKGLVNKSVEVFAEDMSAPFKRLTVASMKQIQSKKGSQLATDIGRLPFESAYSWL